MFYADSNWRRITQAEFSRMTRIHPATIQGLHNENAQKLNLTILN